MKSEPWKAYRRRALKVVEQVREHELPFEYEWLLDLADRLPQTKWISETQMTAVNNAAQAVANMTRYRKMKK